VTHVTVHYAQSIDGRLATRTGDSQWIGGQESLKLAHKLRAEHAAVLVGVGTVIADDPRLTVRLVPGASPLRVVLDSTLRLPLTCNLLTDGAAPSLVLTTSRAAPDRVAAVRSLGADVQLVPAAADGRVDVRCAIEQLGVPSLLIEGGGGIITSALRQRLVQRLVVCISPKLIGAGIEAVSDLGIEKLRDALTFESSTFTPMEEDVIFDGTVRYAG
jgi:riboflavin-specific deaminase-like protein